MKISFKKKNGQSAIEFMILIGATLAFFIAFLVALETQQTDQILEKRNSAVKEIALTVQSEIAIASAARDGYQRTFTLSPDIYSLPYNITIVNDLVYIQTLNGKHTIALSVKNVSGQPIIGKNTIRKSSGGVFLNN